MRRQGPITMRHIIVAVLVVVVINAQLTWWIVFVLRLNRDYLKLERQFLVGSARMEAARVEVEISTARTALEAAVIMGDQPGRTAAPIPFAGWRSQAMAGGCPSAWLNSSGVIEIGVLSGLTCYTGVLSGEWRQRVLEVGDDLEVVSSTDAGPSGVALKSPYEGLTVRPRSDVWDGLLENYRRRIVMMVTEGSFFALLLLVLLGILWRTFRREVELERQHRNFLSAVTHELKSPLAAIRLSLETVTAGRAAGDAADRFLANALEDAGRLEDLVQKVLEATRFSEGGSVIVRKDVHLSRVVEEVTEAFKRRADAAGATLDLAVEPDIYSDVDEEAMSIAVSNLLENAIKYGGKPPRVEMGLTLNGHHAILDIRDNGDGIPEEDVQRVFDRFFRSGDEMTRNTRGTGLGLYLVQQIVDAHRGSVKIESTGEDGTVFRVVLPGYEK
jgi:signal transduction histidine kinase